MGVMWIPGEKVTTEMMVAARIALEKVGFDRLLPALGVGYVKAAPLTQWGTMDGTIPPSVVLVNDVLYSSPEYLAIIALHGATHLYQQSKSWGGLGLEVMAHTVELIYLLLAGIGGYDMRVTLNRLTYYLDSILDDELDALGLVRP